MSSGEEGAAVPSQFSPLSPTETVHAPYMLGPRSSQSTSLQAGPHGGAPRGAASISCQYRLPPVPVMTGTTRYVYGLEPEPPQSLNPKRQRIHSPQVVESPIEFNRTQTYQQYGPYLQQYLLFDESVVRRTFGSAAPGSSASGEEIPRWILDAHTKANYRQIITGVLSPQARSQLKTLPPLVQDAIFHMVLVSSSCWLHLNETVNDVYLTWWRVWAQASDVARTPMCLGEQSLVVFIMRSNFGVPWIAFEKAINRMNATDRNVQFRVEHVWVYSETPESDKACVSVISGSALKPRGSVMIRQNVEKFADDVRQNINSIRTYKWVSLMPLSLDWKKEVRGAVEERYSPHTKENRCIWSWYGGLQVLHQELGGESGINILGSVQNFVGQLCGDVAYHFGPPTRTNAAWWNRAQRQILWFVSPSGGPSRVAPSVPSEAMFDNSAPMLDGSCWRGNMGSRFGTSTVPPMLMPMYPSQLMKVASRNDNPDADVVYVESLTIIDPHTFEVRFAGVPFFLTHLGLDGTLLPNALNQYPCIKTFDVRNGQKNGPPLYNTVCGKHMLCQNCRVLCEVLSCGWDVCSAQEVIFNALVRAVKKWKKEDVENSISFAPCLMSPHICSDECERSRAQQAALEEDESE